MAPTDVWLGQFKMWNIPDSPAQVQTLEMNCWRTLSLLATATKQF